MKFSEETRVFLRNEKFSANAKIPVQIGENIQTNRIDAIKKIVSGKRVINIGCCAHLCSIDLQLENNSHLHKNLLEVSEECIGFDIDEAAVNYLKNNKGWKNIFCSDISSEENAVIRTSAWDYIVLGEILEHVDNPVQFLSEISKKYNKNIDKILITVPLSTNFLNVLYFILGYETINSDHKYTFTPYTIAKVLFEAGYECEEFFTTQFPTNQKKWSSRLFHRTLNFITTLFPLFRESVLVVADFKKK